MAFKTTKKVNEALNKRLKELAVKRHSVKVGVFGAEASKAHGKKNNLYIAQVHEFGADLPNGGRIPERSFLRSTAKEQRQKITQEQAKLLDAFLKGRVTLKKALAVLGESIVLKIKRKIRAGIEPKLKRETIERKGSSTPLIDTGQLINSIGYEVE